MEVDVEGAEMEEVKETEGCSLRLKGWRWGFSLWLRGGGAG